jgi:hypothetical protein
VNSRPAHPAPSVLSRSVLVGGHFRPMSEVPMLLRPGKSASVCDQRVTTIRALGPPRSGVNERWGNASEGTDNDADAERYVSCTIGLE